MKSRITIARKRIVVISLILIIICVLVMLIPKDTSKDAGIVEESVEFSEPTVPNQEPIIKEDGAISILLKRVSGTTAADIQSFSQEYRDGRWIYEGSIKVPKKKIQYNFQIDADLGTIIQWEAAKEQ